MIYAFIPHSLATIELPRKFSSASQILTNMQAELNIAQFNLQQAVERMKAFVDQNRTPRMFREGDRVFLKVPLGSSLTVGQKPKLSPRFCGPWIVIKKISDVACKLQFPNNCKLDVQSQVLYKREWKLQDRCIPEYLVAWTSYPLTDATWELEALICKHFPSLITEESDL
ncbi:hypothetical protein KP509_20G059400 [Ceratopteris richardii]|uniref:Chromo domain-containing protein n=1 Tax=Ceratopteris richardii TaxID=49495 RepID=A0A8T2SJ12_CERRI|nr:hypothetical protein KP509_20G059400 [Ceratopteris richardii]